MSASIYLLLAALFIFGAGAFAAKKILRGLGRKQIIILMPVALGMVLLIWAFLTLWNKHAETSEPAANQPKAQLRPDQD